MNANTEDCIQVICPAAEELMSVCNDVKCTEEGCNASFHSSSNLSMHLIKHHKIANSTFDKKLIDAHYHCPVPNCLYGLGSTKFFQKRKYLKQHFLKVHAAKTLLCNKCKKGFSTESSLNLHKKNCGTTYICACGWTYTSYEAILTHCKRKGHTVFNKIPSEPEQEVEKMDKVNETTCRVDRPVPIYPKVSVPYIAAVALIELSTTTTNLKAVDKEIQTENLDIEIKSSRKTSQNKHDKKRKNSQETQTGSINKAKQVKVSTETQTNSDYTKLKKQRAAVRKRKKSMETQTNKRVKINKNWRNVKNETQKQEATMLKEKHFLNTSNTTSQQDLDEIKKLEDEIFDECLSNSSDQSKTLLKRDFVLNTVHNEDEKTWNELKTELIGCGPRNSYITTLKNEDLASNRELNLFADKRKSGIHDNSLFVNNNSDNLFDINKFSTIETQTELNSFLMDCDDNTSFTLCSTTETQTTDDFDSLVYSNMCTQTCDEIDNLFDFSFVDIETQTAWPDLDDCEYLSS